MKVKGNNCKYCPLYKESGCEISEEECICFRCPRNLGVCISLKYCKETESILIFD